MIDSWITCRFIYIYKKNHENLPCFQRGHPWRLPRQPVCRVWRRPSVLGRLGCDGLPSPDEVGVCRHSCCKHSCQPSYVPERTTQSDHTGSQCKTCCGQRTWLPPASSEASSAAPWGSARRAPSPRRSSWMLRVPTSSSTQRCLQTCTFSSLCLGFY